ncbi:hypothetical protein A3A39_02995 [Candidatus Kaiserbacteria bacterium RIFCSPLOWO2_01_FULL_54_13]|uniref:Methyltransferase n=1 Tax=Candidatus Kaiserbacteria bacterium RIFCSPLOWO2_01_FULL_54_13 TaxID=1798512 RepID=A0A1F6F2H7_9BACT|nr:MAG: hypothetical protein A3A39_02995 [Candidatus Kaiserbacteria bacterium RIFCSPLOWO2_01_FULL_54_13]
MSRNTVGIVKTCQSCEERKLTPILSLGHQPIVQEYLSAGALRKPEVTYPLNLVFCKRCTLLQLDYIVEPKKVFPPEYPYRTGLTDMLVRNFESLADKLEREGYFKPKDVVVDIGSNDGTLLKPFKKKGARVVGVEPTNAAKVAKRNGIPTVQDFFNAKVVRSIVKKHGRAQIVTATNVFAHINDTAALVQNVAALMAKDAVFVSESQYLGDIIKKLEFDTIYHEHLRFYSLRSIAYLLKLHGLSIIDADRISVAGGSIRVYAKKGKHAISERALNILAREKKAGLSDVARLQKFAQSSIQAKRSLLALLLRCKQRGSVAALGSPARSNTLLNFAKIDGTILDCIYEKNGSLKIGLCTPGSHIPVVSESLIRTDKPKFLLMLSWHIGAELMGLMRKKGYRGKFIIPLPHPRIVE